MYEDSSIANAIQRLIESRAPSTPLKIGASGHRRLGEEARISVAKEMDLLFSRLTTYLSGDKRITAVSSLAIGADQLFADAALQYGVDLEVVLPYANFADDFAQGDDRDTYERLLSSANSRTWLPWTERSNGAYLASGLWVVDHSDVLVVVWNGEKAAGVGGTADVVKYCRDAGKPCIHMHSETRQVREL